MALFSSRKNSEQPTIINRVGDWFGWLPLGSGNAPALTHKTALESSTVLSCVKTIAEGCASAPIRLIETVEKDGLETTRIAREHKLHKLLQKPNSYQTSFEFIEGMIANAVLGKGALAIKVTVGQEVRELLPVVSGVWTQEQLSDGSHQFRVSFSDGSQQVFSQQQVVFFRGLSLDGYSSVSAIENARKAVGISNNLETQTLRAASSGGRPSGILAFAEGMNPETKDKLRSQWQERYSAGGEGGIAVLDNNATFTPMQMTAADSQVIENRRFQVQEIARIFRVHPAFLMADGAKVDASIMRFHVKQTLMPWFKCFEQALNRDLLGADTSKFHFDFDEMDLLRGDYSEMTKLFDSALGKGGQPSYMTVQEIRHELGLDPVEADWTRELSKGGYGEVSGLTSDKPERVSDNDDAHD